MARLRHATRPRLLAPALLLLASCACACDVLARGDPRGYVEVIEAKMTSNHRRLLVPIFPRGTGVTLAGVSVTVCAEGGGAASVRLAVRHPALVVQRRGRGARALRLAVTTYTVPYAVGESTLTDGALA